MTSYDNYFQKQVKIINFGKQFRGTDGWNLQAVVCYSIIHSPQIQLGIIFTTVFYKGMT